MRLLTLHKAGLVRLLVGGLVILSSGLAHSQTCVWTGAGANGKWTNPDNWRDGEIPGRINVSGGGIDGNKGDVAQFGPVADGAKTTIDLADVRSVMRLEIVSGAPVYTFGTSSSQPLRLEAHATDGETNGILIDEGVENMPVFAGNMVFFQDYMATAPGTIIENNGSGILDLKPMSAPVKDPEATVSDYGNLYHFYFKGTGDIRVNGQDVDNFGVFHFQQSGKFIVNFQLLGRLVGYYGPFGIIADGELTTPAEVVINKDCCLVPRQQYNSYITVETRDLKVGGEGWLGSQYPGTYNHIKIKTGRTFEISSGYRAINNNSSTALSTLYLEQATGYEGSLCLNGVANAMTNVSVLSRGVVEVQKIGLAGETGSFGEDSVIRFGDASTIRYVGPGETTGKAIVLQSKNNNLLRVTLCHAGTGPWNVASPITLNDKSQTLVLDGERDDATLSSDLADGSASVKLSLAKSGAGTWTIAGACQHTGQTKVSAGALRLSATGSLAASPVLLDGGELVIEDGEETVDKTLPSVAVSANSKLTVEGAASVEIATLSRTSGTLDVAVEEGGSVKISDSSLFGTKPAYLRWNGLPAKISDGGDITIDADAAIAAKGDVVPTGLGSVAITTPGTGGNDTLGADQTTVGKLTHAVDEGSTIEIGASQSLAVESILVAENGGDLSIGTVAGQGVLKSAADIVFENNSTESKLTVKAKAQIGETATVVGAGETILAGGAEGAVVATVSGGTLRLTGSQPVSVGELKVGVSGAPRESVLIVDGASISQGSAPTYIGEAEDKSGVARMVVTNATWVNELAFGLGYADDKTAPNYLINVGHRSDGILEIQSGAVISNRLALGGQNGLSSSVVNPNGVIYQTGGVLAIDGSDYRGSGVGQTAGSAYYCLKDGDCRGIGGFGIGGYNYGYFLQEGGLFRSQAKSGDSATLSIQNANGSIGIYRMTGGTGECYTLNMTCTYNTAGKSAFIMDGLNAAFAAHDVNMCLHSGAGTTANLVLNGGVFKCSMIYIIKEGGCGIVSFGGGTLRAASEGVPLFEYGAYHPVTRVITYDGGAVIDTGGKNVSVTVPIEKATGNGVVGVEGFEQLANRIGAPTTWVTGDGTGAVAVAEWDYATRTVTGIRICSPGVGYTTATVNLYDHAGKRVESYPAVLDANSGKGSFTKVGDGNLSLAVANTWGGDTVLAGGTLKLDNPAALPSGTTLVFQGGKIAANDNPLPLAYAVDGAAVAANGGPFSYNGAFAFPENSTFELKNAESLTNELKSVRLITFVGGITGEPVIKDPGLSDWKLVRAGSSFKFSRQQGLIMIVR